MKMVAACNKYFRAMRPGTKWVKIHHLTPTQTQCGGMIPMNEPIDVRVVRRIPKDGVLLGFQWLGEQVETWLFWPRPGGDISVDLDTEDRIEISTKGKPLLTYIRKKVES